MGATALRSAADSSRVATAVACGAALLVLPIVLYTRAAGDAGFSGVGPAAGIILGIAATALAPLTAALSPVVRHLYLLHYALIAGLASSVLLLPMGDLLAFSGHTLLQHVALCFMAMSGPIVIGHLAASAASRHRLSLALGLVAAVIAATFVQPSGLIWPLLFVAAAVAAAMLLVRAGDDEAPLREMKAWNFVAFLLFNVVVLLGLGTALGIYFYFLYTQTGYDAPFLPDLGEAINYTAEHGLPTLWQAAAARWGAGIVGVVAGALSVFLWPAVTRPGRWHAIAAITCAVEAGLLGGRTTWPGIAVSALLAAGLILIAGSLLAVGPRNSRWPYAIIGAAAGGTILQQVAMPLPVHPVYGAAVWMIEALGLAILWLTAYFAGLQVIRKRG
jgi:hypothetical protein